MTMTETTFIRSYRLARGRMSDATWFALNPSAQTAAIYQAMAEIDAEDMARKRDSIPVQKSAAQSR